MKTLIIAMLLSANSVFAHDLVNCSLFTGNSKRVVELESFDIEKYDTNEPEATIDGSLNDFIRKDGKVFMNFSNECDNNYSLTFKAKDINAARAGKISKIIAHAKIDQAGLEYEGKDDLEVEGYVVCQVKNSK